MPVAVAALSQCTLFSGISSQLVQQAADSMRLLPLRRREVLADAAASLPGLGVVLSGALQAVDETADGREVALETVGVNEAFGFAELLAARSLPVTWMAAAAGTTVGLLPREPAMALLHQPEVALRAAQSLAQRVCDTRGLQKVLTIHPVSARVCAWLNLQRTPEKGAVQVPTHAELAWQLNTTRESVTRVFQRLQADGVIQRDGDIWQVAGSEVLEDWIRNRIRE